MISPLRWLDADELSRSLDYSRPIDLLAEELTGKVDESRQPYRGGSLTPMRADAATDAQVTDLVLFEDERAGARCVLSATGLRACRAAALTGLAARTLLAPGKVSVAVLGSGLAAQTQLMLIARHLDGVHHLAVYLGDDGSEGRIEPSVLNQIDLAGIRLSVVSAVDEAVLSVNLVVTTGAAPAGLDIRAMADGAVLVNATNRDLPDALLDSVDQLYVDDAELVADNLHRYFVRVRRVDADLGQVLTGAHPGRMRFDHILLVELLGAWALDVRLAGMLYPNGG